MIKDRDRSYFVNLLLAVDQFVSAVFGYNADVSISAMLGEIQWVKYHGKSIGWGRPLKATLQKLLDKAEPYHCLKAYRYEMIKRKEIKIAEDISLFLSINKGD